MSTKLTARKRYLPRVKAGVTEFKKLSQVSISFAHHQFAFHQYLSHTDIDFILHLIFFDIKLILDSCHLHCYSSTLRHNDSQLPNVNFIVFRLHFS